MKAFLHRVLLGGLLLAVAVLNTSCFFSSTLEVSAFGNTAFISTTASTTLCNRDDIKEGTATFRCTFFNHEGVFTLTVTDLELIFLLVVLDPLVVQLPDGVSDVKGSYLHKDSDTSGQLAIQTGLASIRADADHTLTAEPGTQLVIIDLPEGAPTTGNFAFNLNFAVPEDAPALEMKALFTGKIDVDGETFYPPIYPCTTEMANVPTLSVPLPAGGTVQLPVDKVEGCQGTVYRFGPSQATEFSIFLPLIQGS